MNKISKKIVALVTMAAFVLTLVPFAAFAAPSQGVDVEASYLAVVNNKGEAQATRTVEVGEPVTAQFFVNDVNGDAVASDGWSTGLLEADVAQEVDIYATKGAFDAEKTSALVVNEMEFNRETDGVNNNQAGASINPVVNPINAQNEYAITTANGRICYGSQVQISFTRTGTYYLYATADGVLLDGAQPTKIVVEEAAQVVDQVALTAQNNDNVFPGNNALVNNDVLQGRTDSTTVTLNNALLPNSIVEYTLTGVASECTNKVNGTIPTQGAQWATLAGETFNLTSNSDNLVLSKDTVTTAPDGSFNISFSLKKAGDYRITLHNSDVNYTINVVYDSTNADIKTVTSNGETLLAGNDTENYIGVNRPANYADAVEFEITDPDGGIVTGDDALDNEPAAHVAAPNGLNHADYLKVDSKPDGSKLTANDLILVANNDSYTLQYVGDDAARDLIPGEYTVTVSLLNGEYATAKMTFAKYGTTQSVVLDMTAVPIAGAGVGGEAVQEEDITDQVKLGRTVTVQARYVDENGVKIDAQDVTYGFDGKAVDSAFVRANRFQTRADQIFNESLFGTTITVTAFDGNKKKIASQELTVVDAYTENSLEFDKTTGAVDTNNNVTVSVVDANGKVVPVTGVLDAYVDAQSNADADVTVKVAKDMTNGADGKLILNSDKDTTADIVVSVKAGNAQYVGTLHYTFGDVAGAGTSVVMTIDSKTILVNNEMDTLDVAPYVKDSRTYVPLRALAQSFGAEVNWDEKTGEITVDGNGTKVVLEVGKTTYTVNDNEKTMDVAPELDSAAGRTLVPVRFVAEALGYTVTAIYGADGTTSSVYFTM